MRIDKFMKVSRLIKRRTVANEVADAGRITVNGKPVKASYAVKEGDVIEVAFGQRPVRVKVVSTEAPTGKDLAREMYVVLSSKPFWFARSPFGFLRAVICAPLFAYTW